MGLGVQEFRVRCGRSDFSWVGVTFLLGRQRAAMASAAQAHRTLACFEMYWDNQAGRRAGAGVGKRNAN